MSRLLQLQQLTGALSTISATAQQARADVAATTAEVQRQSLTMQGSLKAVEGAGQGALATTRATVAEIRRETAQARTAVDRDFSGIEQRADQARANTATALDDIKSRLGDNAFANDLQELIGLVQIGGASIEHLITLYGDAVIGNERLRDVLAGTDLSTYRQEVRALIDALIDGSAGLDEVLAKVSETGGGVAKALQDALTLFEQGKITLEEVNRRLEQIRRQFPDTELSDLARELQNYLEGGGR